MSKRGADSKSQLGNLPSCFINFCCVASDCGPKFSSRILCRLPKRSISCVFHRSASASLGSYSTFWYKKARAREPWPIFSSHEPCEPNLMITFVSGNLFTSNTQVITNTVNCVGVMGKGIALEFKMRYPALFADYRARCADGTVRVGCQSRQHERRDYTKGLLEMSSDLRYFAKRRPTSH